MINNPFEVLKTLDREELEGNEIKKYEGHPQFEIIKKAIRKEKLSVEEQIEYLKFKGVTFIHTSESEAKAHLKESTYYYKVTAFRKNFFKNEDSKYNTLDFASIRDLATIDMHLRYILFKLSLDIEHSIKTKVINLITLSDEDGYTIIDEYDAYQLNNLVSKESDDQKKRKIKDEYVTVVQNTMKDTKNPKGYHKDLYDKHHERPSIWVLIELMSYGALASFIKFYVDREKFGYKQLKDASDFIHYSKNIRDSAAHSRPILFNIIGPEQFFIRHPKLKIKNYLIDLGIPKPQANNNLKNVKTHDLVSILYLHDKYVKGNKARRERKKELISFMKRAKREMEIYSDPELQHFKEVLMIFCITIIKFKY